MNREQFALKQRLMGHGHVPPPARFRQHESHRHGQHAAQTTVIAPAESTSSGNGSGAPRNEIQREKYGRQR